jgi:predicted RNA-binding protein with PUA domain
MKRIVVCGSMKVVPKMLEIKNSLESMGFDIILPNNLEVKNDYSKMTPEEYRIVKNEMIVEHMEEIKNSDAILVVNEKLKDIDGYIGANSFLEMGFAMCFNKKIFLLNPIPDQSNSVEIEGLLPIVLSGDLSLVK